MKKYLLIALLLIGQVTFALPHAELAPGGIAIIPLDGHYQTEPQVIYQDYRVLVVHQKQQWVAVVGIPLTATVGEQKILINDKQTQTFMINAKEYPVQYVTIKNKGLVNPNVPDQLRIKKEQKQMRKILAMWRADAKVNTNFILPVDARIGGQFGVRRFFNNEPRTPHSGVDLMAPAGTPIKAPASGIVRGVGNYFFCGKAVFIDHGQGLITLYCHMQKTVVQNGQTVKQGQVIGTVGQTGRATGPHLHWMVSMNNVRVDPLLFVQKES